METGEGRPPRAVHGRDQLCERFDHLIEQGVGGVVLCGPQGVGKSRLGAALVERAAAAGRRTTFLRSGVASIDIPLGTFLPLLPNGLRATDAVSLLLAARDAIEEWAGDDRPILGVDDVHLTDPTSATLLHQLVSAGTVTLVATFRSREWVPDPVAQLWLSGPVQLWELDALDRPAMDAVASDMCGRTLDRVVLDRLWELTAGNALFLHALTRPLAELEDPTPADLDRLIADSHSLVDFLDARLSGLSDQEREALTMVALAEPIGLDAITELVDESLLARLEADEYIQVLTDDRRTDLRLAHPLYGELLRSHTSRLAARAIYRRLATAVQAHGAHRDEDALRIALWAVDGGLELDRAMLMRAGARALNAGDVVLVERLVADLWNRHRDVDAGLMLLTGWLLGGATPERTTALANELESLVVTLPQQRRLMSVALRNAMWRLGDEAEVDRVLGWFENVLEPESATHDGDGSGGHDEALAELWANQAFVHAYATRFDEAQRLASRVEEVTTHPRARIPAALAVLNVWGGQGEAAQVEAAIEQFAAIGTEGGTTALPRSFIPTLLSARTRPLMLRGDIVGAEQAATEAYELSLAENDDGSRSLALFGVASVLQWRGRIRTALETAREARRLAESGGFRSALRWALMIESSCAASLGRADEATVALARMEALAPNLIRIRDGWAWHARVFTAMAQGNRDAAADIAAAGVRDLRAIGTPLEEAVLLDILARLGDERFEPDRIAELGMRGGMFATLADHALGLHRDDPAALGRAATAWAEGGADVLASIAAASAAESHARHGDQRAARRFAGLAESLRDATRDEVGPGLVPVPVVAAVPLSRREREVAELAATGMPAKDIAEKLYLSTRTVENHIGRIYDKVGVRSRAELRDLLRG
jgi:ATP/maltotriose-dependent transcriptional regulator MalT